MTPQRWLDVYVFHKGYCSTNVKTFQSQAAVSPQSRPLLFLIKPSATTKLYKPELEYV